MIRSVFPLLGFSVPHPGLELASNHQAILFYTCLTLPHPPCHASSESSQLSHHTSLPPIPYTTYFAPWTWTDVKNWYWIYLFRLFLWYIGLHIYSKHGKPLVRFWFITDYYNFLLMFLYMIAIFQPVGPTALLSFLAKHICKPLLMQACTHCTIELWKQTWFDFQFADS